MAKCFFCICLYTPVDVYTNTHTHTHTHTQRHACTHTLTHSHSVIKCCVLSTLSHILSHNQCKLKRFDPDFSSSLLLAFNKLLCVLLVQVGASTDFQAQSYITPTTFLGYSSVACSLSVNYSVDISVSLDGVNSGPSLRYIVHDSHCERCSDSTCTPRVS